MGGGQYQLSVYKEKQKVGEKLQERAKLFSFLCAANEL